MAHRTRLYNYNDLQFGEKVEIYPDNMFKTVGEIILWVVLLGKGVESMSTENDK